MTQDSRRAEIARQTADLVAAYCQTLDIKPADLPELIAYVGSVIGRGSASADDHQRPASADSALQRQQAIIRSLAEYKCARGWAPPPEAEHAAGSSGQKKAASRRQPHPTASRDASGPEMPCVRIVWRNDALMEAEAAQGSPSWRL